MDTVPEEVKVEGKRGAVWSETRSGLVSGGCTIDLCGPGGKGKGKKEREGEGGRSQIET